MILELLRFGSIGVLNFSIHAIVVNMVSKHLGINEGLRLGIINISGFVVAVVQSYIWNRYWTFGKRATPDRLYKNFLRLVIVGVLGLAGFIFVMLGARAGALAYYYGIVLALYVAAEYGLWVLFGLSEHKASEVRLQFVKFLIISVIGLAINSVIVSIASTYLNNQDLALAGKEDIIKNVALVFANIISLVWNFIGYKLLVFKK